MLATKFRGVVKGGKVEESGNGKAVVALMALPTGLAFALRVPRKDVEGPEIQTQSMYYT
jgi:hypothetical protein